MTNDDDEVKVRGSNNDEIYVSQEQLLLFAPGSFHHSRLNSGFVVDTRKFETTDNSYRVLVEENKSEREEYVPNDEKFEIIREDVKDSFVSPHRGGERDNSDFKKFTGEDDTRFRGHHYATGD